MGKKSKNKPRVKQNQGPNLNQSKGNFSNQNFPAASFHTSNITEHFPSQNFGDPYSTGNWLMQGPFSAGNMDELFPAWNMANNFETEINGRNFTAENFGGSFSGMGGSFPSGNMDPWSINQSLNSGFNKEDQYGQQATIDIYGSQNLNSVDGNFSIGKHVPIIRNNSFGNFEQTFGARRPEHNWQQEQRPFMPAYQGGDNFRQNKKPQIAHSTFAKNKPKGFKAIKSNTGTQNHKTSFQKKPLLKIPESNRSNVTEKEKKYDLVKDLIVQEMEQIKNSFIANSNKNLRNDFAKEYDKTRNSFRGNWIDGRGGGIQLPEESNYMLPLLKVAAAKRSASDTQGSSGRNFNQEMFEGGAKPFPVPQKMGKYEYNFSSTGYSHGAYENSRPPQYSGYGNEKTKLSEHYPLPEYRTDQFGNEGGMHSIYGSNIYKSARIEDWDDPQKNIDELNEDLRIELLRLKQKKIELQLEELNKKSQETDRELALLEDRSHRF